MLRVLGDYFAPSQQVSANINQLLTSFQSFETIIIDRFIQGKMLSGYSSCLTVKEASFLNVGELLVLSNILSRILQHQAAINSFHELHVVGADQGRLLTCPTTFL